MKSKVGLADGKGGWTLGRNPWFQDRLQQDDLRVPSAGAHLSQLQSDLQLLAGPAPAESDSKGFIGKGAWRRET